MGYNNDTRDQGEFRNTIATVKEDGRRQWIFPRKPVGRFYQWRSYLSYFLLAVLFGLPWLRINGNPFIRLNVLEREFYLFGQLFSPQDFYLLAILMITLVVFISLFTVVYGRLFCGWVCPQTIFMEMIFRKIEYWVDGDASAQKRLDKAPWTPDKMRKRLLKHGLFALVATVIAHTFLAYIIGTESVLETVTSSPLANPAGFIAIVIFTAVFYFVFARMREQVCIAICPYGRLQGVLLDEDSVNVMYDYNRGEPRGKISKGKPKKSSCTSCEDCRSGKDACADRVLQRMEAALTTVAPPPAPAVAPKGDCIDCKLCVQVCPTGIDIRNGVQLECINCTACIDACDGVMDKIKRPRGLIRYDSERGVREGKRKKYTPRTIAYSIALGLLIVLNVFLLSGRDGFDVILLRAPGTLWQETPTMISNLYTFQIVNKTGEDQPFQISIKDLPGAAVRTIGDLSLASSTNVTEGALFVDIPTDGEIPSKIEIVIEAGDAHRETHKLSFLKPKNK
ncbi:MAG: 4Fe-4S dicluster domain-containing protein [Bacteroidota bacterium]